ncbi:glycosyltransferase [Steroidobacter sp. S1-65]|uniref:Glycosyltransferase n=1 Tax=Steroidobacter gossypii TaxID=2805490 RepID=A0ABS1X4A1_9GAMM|nr:glycosyltransferase [Steroidobacter gossypii]MBM0108043.1 glycosyltransferase [Steroidobacter gossypii]
MTAKVTMAMFGSSLVSAYWNGAATYYRGMIRALNECGFDVTFYEPDAFERQQHRDMADPPWAKVVVYPATQQGLHAALEQAREADIIVKASGVGVFDEELEAEVPRLRRASNLTVFWDVDAPATLQRMRADSADPFHSQVRNYDLVLTYGGGPPVVQAYVNFGARRCVPIYNALDPTTHHPVPAESRFSGALGFLGNRLPDREARVHEFFLKPASLLPQQTFLMGGSGWESNVALTPNINYVGHVYTRDHNAFNCSTLAVLNINRDSMAQVGYSPPTRVFEAAGAGACLVCDAWEGLEQFLEPGKEVLRVANGEEVAAVLPQLTEQQARRIGERARRRLLNEHTYQHRAQQVSALLVEQLASRARPARYHEERHRAAL